MHFTERKVHTIQPTNKLTNRQANNLTNEPSNRMESSAVADTTAMDLEAPVVTEETSTASTVTAYDRLSRPRRGAFGRAATTSTDPETLGTEEAPDELFNKKEVEDSNKQPEESLPWNDNDFETQETTAAEEKQDDDSSDTSFEKDAEEPQDDEKSSASIENQQEEEEELEEPASPTQPPEDTTTLALPESEPTQAPDASVTTDTVVTESEPQTNNSKNNNNNEEPPLADILASTDRLFDLVEDKSQVTVKDIVQSLTAEFQISTLVKTTKKAVKARLTQLILEQQQQEDSDDSDPESEDDTTHDDDDEFTPETSTSKRPTRRPKTNRRKAAAALRIQTTQARKRRLLELQTRNEELLQQHSQADQQRAEQIAAKFATDTDEQRLQRLEQQWGLLGRLDQKRWAVLKKQQQEGQEDEQEEGEAKDSQPEPPTAATPPPPVQELESDSSDESSDDDDELEIVGAPASRSLAKAPTHHALAVLDQSPRQQKQQQQRKSRTLAPSLAHLRHTLKAKQRQMGNLWLAQELGYKTEQEHLHECVQLEAQKRLKILHKEQERLAQNERKQQRILQMGLATEEEETLEDSPAAANTEAAEEPEEDEEMEMAREMEIEITTEDPTETSTSLEQTVDASAEVTPASDNELATEIPPEEDGLDAQEGFETQVPETMGDPVVAASVATTNANETASSSAPSAEGALVSEDSAGPNITDDKLLESTHEEVSGDSSQSSENQDSPTTAVEADDSPEEPAKPKGPRNAAWKAMLAKDAEKSKKKRKSGLVDDEADEEEEEEVAGLEDFGFTVKAKKKDSEEEDEDVANTVDEDDMENVVDELSDDEGDEDAGEAARKSMEQKEEKRRHKEIMRRMREGYDGRRGGIAGGAGARGMHGFDQLVAADNYEDAKRLGLANDDEMDSDTEEENIDDGEDEAAILDKALKDRWLHRSSVEVEETFSDDEEEPENNEPIDPGVDQNEVMEENEQERLAKRFAKRARMQRLLDAHGHEEEFSQSRLIDEDADIKADLLRMKVSKEFRAVLSLYSSFTISLIQT